MKKIVVITLFSLRLLFFTTELQATLQIQDEFFIDGISYKLNVYPLEQYFRKGTGFNGKTPSNFFRNTCENTACWRGYQAFWELTNDTLYLNDVLDCCFPSRLRTTKRDTLNKELYFNQKVDKIFAKWYSGKIVLRKGKFLEVEYFHAKYGFLFESFEIIEIIKGIVTKKQTIRVSERKNIKGFYRVESDKISILIPNSFDYFKGKNEKQIKGYSRLVDSLSNTKLDFKTEWNSEMLFSIKEHEFVSNKLIEISSKFKKRYNFNQASFKELEFGYGAWIDGVSGKYNLYIFILSTTTHTATIILRSQIDEKCDLTQLKEALMQGTELMDYVTNR